MTATETDVTLTEQFYHEFTDLRQAALNYSHAARLKGDHKWAVRWSEHAARLGRALGYLQGRFDRTR